MRDIPSSPGDGTMWHGGRPVTVIGAPPEPVPEGFGQPSAATLAEMAAGRAIVEASTARLRVAEQATPVLEPEIEIQVPAPRRGRPPKPKTETIESTLVG